VAATQISLEWVFTLLIFTISTFILIAMLLISSPLQKWLLEPMLRRADRHSVGTGINEQQVYGQSGEVADVE